MYKRSVAILVPLSLEGTSLSLNEHMQHHVLPRVDMKRETFPRVTTVGNYDVDVVRNGLIFLPNM